MPQILKLKQIDGKVWAMLDIVIYLESDYAEVLAKVKKAGA